MMALLVPPERMEMMVQRAPRELRETLENQGLRVILAPRVQEDSLDMPDLRVQPAPLDRNLYLSKR
jgi:hypothetical protein